MSYLKKLDTLPKKAAVILLSFLIAMVFTVPTSLLSSYADTVNPGSVATGYDVDCNISLSEDANDVTLKIPMNGMTKDELSENINNNKVTLSLVRDKDRKYLDTNLYPYQEDGGLLSSWKTQGDTDMFTDISMKAEEENGKTELVVTMDINTYFYSGGEPDHSAPHSEGGDYLDKCGYFNFTAAVGDISGSAPVKVVPYADYHTMSEIYSDLEAIENYSNHLYVKKQSMGTSTDGRDMPYLIIAKNQKAVSQWLSFASTAESNPDKALKMIKNGECDDLKVPVMYSNVHANEIAATDSVMDFAWKLVKEKPISYDTLTGFTEEGKQELSDEMGEAGKEGSVAIPDLTKKYATQLGYLKAGNSSSGSVDLTKYYNVENKTFDVDDALDDVFFILVPEENVDGRTYTTREAGNGYDLNRDNSFQTTNETSNMQHLISMYNPVSLVEFHGRVKNFQIEPCDPPHEPNFEYDLLSEHLTTGGEALGIGAVANNTQHNSYVMPQRDYLTYTGEKESDGSYATKWEDPWDDMSTSYTPQFAMLQGTVAYTVELPSYSQQAAKAGCYGMISQSAYIAKEKLGYLEDQVKIFKRGHDNANSDSYSQVGQYLTDQNDVEGAESGIFRPEYDGKGENGNFYPECYIIPMDGKNQKNLQAASDMMVWLTRNDVKVNVAKKSFKYNGKTYPKGTMVVSMYQAKRSVANGVLNNGTLIQNWTALYSEGITAFNKTRGFDMATCAEPASYKKIKKALGTAMNYSQAKSYVSKQGSYFTGVKNADVIISNASEDSTSAVNALLKAGKKVGMITEGSHQDDFITSYKNYKKVAKKYQLTAKGVYGENYTAQVIKGEPSVYITGEPEYYTAGCAKAGKINWRTYYYNYDKKAMKLLNFKVTKNAAKADVVIGSSALDSEGLSAVQDGVPYIGYSSRGASTSSLSNFFDGVERNSLSNAMDCLGYVTYPEKTAVNASYIKEKDNIMYGYGCGYFTGVPSDAKVLVKMKNKTPLEGFIPLQSEEQKSEYKTFLDGSVQAFSYTGEDKSGNEIDVAFFANTLTNKAHQRDEYNFVSNFIFSKNLGLEYEGEKDPSASEKTTVKIKGTGKASYTVSWKKVKKAAKYKLYQKVGSGSYKLVKKTSGTKYTLKHYKDGVTYSFKVKAGKKKHGKISYGSASKAASVTTASLPETVQGVSVSAADGSKVTVTWDEVTDAGSYEVIYKKDSGSYKSLATVKGSSVTTKTLKAGSTYKFKVKAVKKANGKVLKSSKWSAGKTIKVS